VTRRTTAVVLTAAALAVARVLAACNGGGGSGGGAASVDKCAAALKVEMGQAATQVAAGQATPDTPNVPAECKGLTADEQTQAANEALQGGS
jgi:hypothetical protein